MHSLAHVVTTWEDVLAQLRRKSVRWRGNPLSERDLLTFTEAIVMCALHLTDLSTRFSGIGDERGLITWCHDMTTIDVAAIGSFLSDAVTLLRNVAEPTTYSWFKRQLRDDFPFTGKILAPIKGQLMSFLEHPNAESFAVCYQFLSFLTHLSLRDIPYEDESEYEEMEAYLRKLQYPDSIVARMNSIMREWMEGFSLSEENFHPQHGPGAVAELPRSATVAEKYLCLGTDPLIDYVFRKFAGINVTSYYAGNTGTTSLLEWPRVPCSDWVRQSKLVFVPKSMKTRRTISKEPATLQFLQQGVDKAVKHYVHHHPSLSRHIDFRDQEKNAMLAIESSRTGAFATIDLSSASDTVTLKLVKAVFRGTPLYPYLVALRSQTVLLPSGKELRVEKYAPMGSALCFPVQTLIFACAVEYAVRRARDTHLGFFPRYRVYGDDIIVDDRLVEDVILVLEALGFILNKSKTFYSPKRFRESCGGDGYDGCVVTPMRISRRFYSTKDGVTARHASWYEGIIELANQSHAYGFSLLRIWCIRSLYRYTPAPPLFSREGDGSVFSLAPTNYRALTSYNDDYQREEIKVAMSRPVSLGKDDAPDLVVARYVETLRLIRDRSDGVFYPDDRIQVLPGSRKAKLRAVWHDKPY